MRSFRLSFLALFACATLLTCVSGCTALNLAINSGGVQADLIQNGIELGVSTLIGAQPVANRPAFATQVIQAATLVEGLIQNSPAAASTLDTDIAKVLAKTKIAAPLQALIVQVVNAGVQKLQPKIAKGVLSAGSQTPIMTVMGWVIAGAIPYAPPAAVATAQREGEAMASSMRFAALLEDADTQRAADRLAAHTHPRRWRV